MQMTHLNQHRRSPVLTHSQSITNRYKYITDKFPSALQPIVIYLLSIPFVGLSIRILHCIWRVFAFIISALAGKPLAKQRKVDRTKVIPLEPERHDETEQERQLKEHFLVMASHELKTPMTTILGQVQLMLRRLSKMPELSYELATMRSALESDNGPGIPKNEQSRIFEPFYRGSDVQTTVKSGLGLGLTICKDIVERHAGRIWCRSRPGKGSIFIVELPLSKTRPRKVR